MKWALSERVLPWLIALAGALVLAGAHLLEALGWAPCELCLRQRVPYWIGIGIAAMGGLLALPRLGRPQLSSGVMALAALTFGAGAALAVQHIGVEEHWWKSTCSTSQAGGASISELISRIGTERIVACDDKRAFLFGLTLADYNLLISTGLAVFAASLPWRRFVAKPGRLRA